MSSDFKPIGVGVIGSGPFAWHLCERLSVRQDFAAIARWPADGDPASSLLQDDGEPPRSFQAVVDDGRVHVLYFVESVTAKQIAMAIQSQKHVVLQSTASLGMAELRRLADLSAARGTIAVVDQPRRWEDDFLNARSLVDAGQFGNLQRIRLAIHEQSLPGELFPRGVLRELGGPWLDQLLAFVDDEIASVQIRRFRDSADTGDSGFLAVIDFAGGVSAVVELQIQSLLSLRTGWLLEGTAGAYRAGRRYSKTADGEIIDEPVNRTPGSTDPFWDALAAAIGGDHSALASLPDLSHAVRVTALIEKLEESELWNVTHCP